MRLTRSQFVIWNKMDGGTYIIIALGEGVFEKMDGFRSRHDAEGWIERQLRRARLERLEDTLFDQPWLPALHDKHPLEQSVDCRQNGKASGRHP